MMPEKRPYIITFKVKDKRYDKNSDKIDILRDVLGSDLYRVDSGEIEKFNISENIDNITFDIDEYDAPIVTIKLTPEELEKLRKNPNIQKIERDENIFISQGHIHNSFVDVHDSWGISSIHAPQAWNISKGKDIKIAILDTGIDQFHKQLSTNFKEGVSFVENEIDITDFNGHGTAVAGIVGASNNEAIIGVAPKIDLYCIKIVNKLGIGNTSSINNAIQWSIKNKIDIINMSLGDSGNTTSLELMCKLAQKKGLLLISAAGNNGSNVVAPANFKSVMAVSAIDDMNSIYINSSRGPEIDLCAPGVKVISTLPDNKYGLFSGTSFACPHVAGSAGLVWGSNRSFHNIIDNISISKQLIFTADQINNDHHNINNHHNLLFGFGRVNAEKAVQIN
jgi:subtilisin